MLVLQSCLTLCDLRDCSLPDSSVHGIFQARIVEWVAIPFSRGSSLPGDRTWVSHIARGFFTVWAIREAPLISLLTRYKGIQLRSSQLDWMHRAGNAGWDTKRRTSSPDPPSSQNLHMFTNTEALQMSSWRIFMEFSLSRHDWVHHWPLWLIKLLVSFLSLEVKGKGWKFQPSALMLGSPGHQHPSESLQEASSHQASH